MFFMLLLVIHFISSRANQFVDISWNITESSAIFSNRHNYEYDNTCDLTVGVCDSWCCSDVDCSSHQKSSFNCSRKGASHPVKSSDQPYWFKYFSYVYDNSPFLGLYYNPIPDITDLETWKNLSHKKIDYLQEKIRPYKFNDPVLIINHQTKTPRFLLTKIPVIGTSQVCIESPVKYSKNYTAACLVELSFSLCEDKLALSLLPYLINSNFSKNASSVVGNILTMRPIEANIFVFNVSTGSYITNITDLNHLQTRFNPKFNVCENVLQSAHFHFLTYGDGITNVTVSYNVSSVQMNDAKVDSFLQVFSVMWRDLSATESCQSCGREDFEDIFNRGYIIGEPLVSGYLKTNDTRAWETSQWRIFTRGGECKKTVPIMFGFEMSTACRINFLPLDRKNCTTKRLKMESTIKDLFSGDYLAPYPRFQEPWLSPVPLLTGNIDHGNFTNVTCAVPQSASLTVLYTGVPMDGRLVYRAVGAHLKILSMNVSTSTQLTFTSSVAFISVPSKEARPRSRFWEKVFSDEEGSLAWFNLFKAFDGALTGDETEEAAFWTFVVVIFSLLFFLFRGCAG